MDNAFGRWLEHKLKERQLPKIRQESSDFAERDELSFHPQSKQEWLVQEFRKRLPEVSRIQEVAAGDSGAAGSEGQMINIEIRQQLPEKLMVAAFYDWGRVSKTTITNLDSYNLSGYGLSVSWVGPYQTNIKAIWARRIGNNRTNVYTGCW